MNSRGMTPPTIAFSKAKPSAALAPDEADLRVAELTAAARLAHETTLALGRAGDRLLVGDLRAADVGLDLELAHQAVDDDLEVQLAHAGDDVCPVSGSVLNAEGRIFLRQLGREPGRASPGRPWSSARSATEITGSGKLIDSRITGCFGVADRVAGRHPLETHGRGDVTGPDLLDLFALVGVHLEQAADALGAAAGSR